MLLLFFITIIILNKNIDAMGINSFRFLNTDTIYGTQLNQEIDIYGVWSVHALVNSDNINNWQDKDAKMIANKYPNSTYVCLSNTDHLTVMFGMTNVSDLIETNLVNLKKTASATMFQGLETLIKDLTRYSCSPLTSKIVGHPNAQEYEFKISYTFTDYKPVIFFDYFGFASFNYKLKKIKDTNHEHGKPIRFCDDDLSNQEEIYSVGKTPSCPDISKKDEAVHEEGFLTVFKKNIVTVTHLVHKCSYTKTHMHSGKRFFGSKFDNRPLVGILQVPSVSECLKMVNLKKSKYGDLKATNVPNSWTTSNPKDFEYPWCGSKSKDVYDAFLTTASLRVELPSLKIVTPWGDIPKDLLYTINYYTPDNRGILVWETIKKTDVCMYVPMMSAPATSIMWPHNSSVVKEVNNMLVEYVRYFKVPALKALLDVDNTMLSKKENYNCIMKGEHEVLYVTHDNRIVRFTPATSKSFQQLNGDYLKKHEVKNYPHTNFEKIDVTDNHELVDVRLKNTHPTHTKNRIENAKNPTSPPPKLDTKAINAIVSPTSKPTLIDNDTATNADIIAYNDYINGEIQKKNNIAAIKDSCEKMKLQHQFLAITIDLNPTRTITLNTHKLVQAFYAGTGRYRIKRCEMVENVRIIPTLKTDSNYKVTLNGETITVKEIAKRLKVVPSRKKCFATPIIIFKFSYMPPGNSDSVAQLDHENILQKEASLLEKCSVEGRGSSTFMFEIYEV